MSNKTFKIFVDKMGGRTASTYIGSAGEIFYDPEIGALRLSDGTTPGGSSLTSGGAANTGDVTFSGIKIIGAGTASGDGNGYSTLELVPDNNLYSNHQYLVIDPTVPSHIHIRAGGLQDQSNAELYLGGEKTNVRVSDYGGVRLNRTSNDFLSSNSYASPADFTLGTWFTEGGLNYIQYTTLNPTLGNHIYELGNNLENYVTVYWNGGSEAFTLRYAGSSQDMGGGVFRVQVDAAPSAEVSIENMYWEFYIEQSSSVDLTTDFTVNVRDDVRITARDIFNLRNYSASEPIQIRTDYDNADHTWSFEPNGTLSFPQGGNLRINGAVPLSSIGDANDKSGTIALDTTYFYYCTADYDGTTNIWKRVAWSNDTW